jgi:hypothetical protein
MQDKSGLVWCAGVARQQMSVQVARPETMLLLSITLKDSSESAA